MSVLLTDYLRAAAASKQGIRFIESSSVETFLGYNDLLDRALKTLGFLQSRGVQQGDQVIFQMEDNQNFLESFWGCVLGGIIPVPINPAFTPETRSKLINVWNALSNPYILTEEKAYSSFGPKIHEDELQHYQPSHLLHCKDIKDSQEAGVTAELHPHDTAFIQFSSGSTGSPKGVVLSHENLIINIHAISNCSDLGATDSTLGWMPLTHDLGLIGFHLTPLVNCIHQYLIPTSVFIRRPSLWISKINEHRVTFTASPNFGYKHFLSFFKEEAAENWELSCVRRILNGAEPISADLCSVFLDFLGDFGLSPTVMFPVYGMAEASLAVAFPTPGEHFEYVTVHRDHLKMADTIVPDEQGVSFVCVGTPVDNCEVRICSDNYIPLGEMKVGHVEIKGGNVTRGYYNNPDANKQAFNSDGWLRTGDLGFFKDGKLYITGRSKDIIFSNGQNIYPHDIERIIEEVEGVDLGKVVVCGVPNEQKYRDEVLAFIFFKGKPEEFVDLAINIKAHANRKLSLELDAVLPVKSIEKTTSGKVKRFHYAEEYSKGVYDELKDTVHNLMLKKLSQRKRVEPQNELQRELFLIWTHILGRNDIGIHENFFELGGNSLKANMVLGRISKDMKMELTIREIFKSPTIASLAEIIKDKKEQKFTSIPRTSERQFYPCSSAQKRLFVLNRLEPQSISYNISSIHKIVGALDIAKLEQAFQLLVSKHQILRTHFQIIDGNPVQKVTEHLPVAIERLTVTNDLETTVRSFIRPFNILEPALFRIGLIFHEGAYYLIFDIHHIISDGYSLNLIIKEFSYLYSGASLQPVDTTYVDYAVWQTNYLSSDLLQKQQEYWLSVFADDIPTLNFPVDFQRTQRRSQQGDAIYFDIEQDIYRKMVEVATEENSTFYILFLTVLNVTLARYCGQDDIIVGSPISSRPHADLQDVFGPFINTLALRNKPSGDITLKAFHREVIESTLNALSNHDYPYEQLIDHLDMSRDVSRNALFDVLFVLQNANNEKVELKDLDVQQVDFFNGEAKIDLNIHAWEGNEAFKFKVEFRNDLYSRESITQFAHHFKNTLAYFVQHQDAKIEDVQLLSPDEKEQLLTHFNSSVASFDHQHALTLFENQVQQHSGDTAVVFGDTKLSFQEVNDCANYYAKQLVQAGVQSGDFVGISIQPSDQLVIAILASWKAGAAYVPVDPNNPEERKNFIIQDSGIKAIFSESSVGNVPMIAVDNTRREAQAPVLTKLPDDTAYVIYTSGTTGVPKGTLIRHSGLANYCQAIGTTYQIGKGSSSMLMTSYAFDLGYTSLFGALLNGGTIHICDEQIRNEASRLIEYIVDHDITFIKTTPSQLFTITSAINFGKLKEADRLQKIFIGGESIKVEDVKKVLAIHPNMEFINHYGPTESTIGCITHRITDVEAFEKRPVIGSPLPNIQIYVLDKNKQPVPIGVEGEIHISGAGLAKAYHNNEANFKAKFIDHPFVPGTVVYATGDVGKWTRSGTIQFLGRNDDQVKIRGYRVELEGVKSKILAIDGIQNALVLGLKDNHGHNFLCAYVIVTKPNINYREALSSRLPEYMVPTYFVEIDEIPITSNGKLDKKRLPAPEIKVSASTSYATTDIQHKLVKIWKEVLDTTQEIAIDENFFELGGHSLKATIVIAKVHKEFNVELPLKEFFIHPTIQELEKLIESREVNPFAEIPLTEVKPYYPVSSAQKRMYVLNQLEGDSTSYNMPGAFWVSGPLDIQRLRATFHQLIKRHESLRTSFEMKDGEAIQIIHHSFDFELEMIQRTAEPIEAQIKRFIRSFDVSKAPLFRVGIIRETAHKHLLIFDIHHIISDGSSMGMIVKDFIAIYDDQQLPKLRIQYKDYAVWQKQFYHSDYIRQQKEYWLEEFSQETPPLELPTDFERPKTQQFDGESFVFSFDEALTQQLRKVCAEHDITMFMLLMGVYQIFLAKQTNQEEFIVGTPIAGRPHVDLHDIIGVFLNTLAIKGEPTRDKFVVDFLQEIKEKALKAYENQHYQFNELVEELDLERQLNRNPLFDTMLVVQNMDVDELRTGDLVFEQHEFDLGSAQLDLSLIVFEREKSLDFTINYSTKLFKKATVQQFVKRLRNTATQVCGQLQQPIAAISLLSEEDKKQLLVDFDGAQLPYNSSGHVLEIIAKTVAAQPNKVAFVDDHTSSTYQEFGIQTNRLANMLISMGIGPGSIIPIVMGRSLNTVTSIVGVVKTGASYVFVDPNYPAERIDFMLHDCKSDLLITESAYVDKMTYSGVKIVMDETDLSVESNTAPVVHIAADSLAYLIYTSGSTGQPKGVMISHKNLNSFVHWAMQEFARTDFDMVYNTTSYSFDLSIFEIFFSLASGKTVRILQDGLHIPKYVDTDQKVLINTVPVVVKELIANHTSFRNVVAINMAGEPIPQIVKDGLDYKAMEVRNLYGPSEDTTYSTCFRFTENNTIQNIGKPIANTSVYILNQNLELLPMGVPGELCLTGDGISLGYLNREELTKEKFITNPLDPSKMLYRTGDLAKWLPNGDLEYLGRIDNQVKIRGFRIELQEIEQRLFTYPEISDCVVVDVMDENTAEKFICAYYLAEKELDTHPLRMYLSQFLPAYMIPTAFVKISEIPTTPNGKINKKALPYPDLQQSDEEIVLPVNEIEEKLVEVWKQVLKMDRIGVNTNFFSLGGDSIKAIQVASKLNQENLKIEVKQFFEAPTIAQLAPLVKRSKAEISQSEVTGEYPLGAIQHHFFAQQYANVHHWNQAVILAANTRIDAQKLKDSFEQVLRHHDVLRSRFVNGKAEIMPSSESIVRMETIEVDNDAQMLQHCNDAQRSLNLEKGETHKIVLFHTPQGDQLFIVLHHLVIDGISWRIVLEDVQRAYAGGKLPYKTHSFGDWNKAMVDFTLNGGFDHELSYWQEASHDISGFPYKPESTPIIAHAKMQSAALNADVTTRLIGEANTAYNTDVNDLLLSALALAFNDANGVNTLTIALEGHGREQLFDGLDIGRTVGWFTSLFPVKLRCEEEVRETIITNKDALKKVPNKGVGFGVLKYIKGEALQPELPIVFNYLGDFESNGDELFSFSDAEIGATSADENSREFPFEFNLIIKHKQLVVNFRYDTLTMSDDEAKKILDVYIEKLTLITDHCMGKEDSEITISDVEFDISTDDFENIFG